MKILMVAISLLLLSDSAFSEEWINIRSKGEEIFEYSQESVSRIEGDIYLIKTRESSGELDLGENHFKFPPSSITSTAIVNCKTKSQLIFLTCIGDRGVNPVMCNTESRPTWVYSIEKKENSELIPTICAKIGDSKENNARKANEFANTKITDELCECYQIYTFLENVSRSNGDREKASANYILGKKSLDIARTYKNEAYIQSKLKQQEAQIKIIAGKGRGSEEIIQMIVKSRPMCEYILGNTDDRYKFWESYQGPGK